MTNEEFALECRPINPEIHDKEEREFYNLPKCTCDKCNEFGCADTWHLVMEGSL